METWQCPARVGSCSGGGEEKEMTAVQFVRQGEATADINVLQDRHQYAG